MSDVTDEIARTMQCPFCGHRAESRGIGEAYCGPHGNGHGISPARRMFQVQPIKDALAEDAAHNPHDSMTKVAHGVAAVDNRRDSRQRPAPQPNCEGDSA